MASFPVTITTNNTPPVQVYGVNVSYNEILQSLGAYCYLIEGIFMQTLSALQVNEYLQFIKFNSDGIKQTDVVNPALDLYAYQPAILLELQDREIIIDGKTSLNFNLLAGQWMRLTFITYRNYLAQGLDQFGPSNKKRVAQ